MTMTGRERNVWLSQIGRIHHEQRVQRERETRESAELFRKLREEAELSQ